MEQEHTPTTSSVPLISPNPTMQCTKTQPFSFLKFILLPFSSAILSLFLSTSLFFFSSLPVRLDLSDFFYNSPFCSFNPEEKSSISTLQAFLDPYRITQFPALSFCLFLVIVGVFRLCNLNFWTFFFQQFGFFRIGAVRVLWFVFWFHREIRVLLSFGFIVILFGVFRLKQQCVRGLKEELGVANAIFFGLVFEEFFGDFCSTKLDRD